MIVIFGSINIDQVYQMTRLPAPGETLSAENYLQVPGGKGANQALAARRAGASVTMIGCVGDDENAEPAMQLMSDGGVSLAVQTSSSPTGCASIWVDGKGENSIVVCPGANADIDADHIDPEAFEGVSLLAVQMEVPVEQNIKVLRHAKQHGVKTVCNLAPFRELPRSFYDDLDFLVVNETEAAALGDQLGLIFSDDEELAMKLSEFLSLQCILTRGEAGVIVSVGNNVERFHAHKVSVVDTTAAGDSFIGAFLAEYEKSEDVSTAIRFAVKAASLTCTREGAQPSIPYRAEVESIA